MSSRHSSSFMIEYNCSQDALHMEELSTRLSKNVSEIFHFGKPLSRGWVMVGILPDIESAARYCSEFRTLLDKAAARRANSRQSQIGEMVKDVENKECS